MNGDPEQGRAVAAAGAGGAAATAAAAALAGEKIAPFTWHCSLMSVDLWKISKGSLFIDLPLLTLICST